MARKKITDEQLQEELNAGMKNIDIARKYGISDRVIRIRKAKLAKKGVGHGRDVSHLVPDGYKIKGTSSLVDEFGNTKLQWVKTDTEIFMANLFLGWILLPWVFILIWACNSNVKEK